MGKKFLVLKTKGGGTFTSPAFSLINFQNNNATGNAFYL